MLVVTEFNGYVVYQSVDRGHLDLYGIVFHILVCGFVRFVVNSVDLAVRFAVVLFVRYNGVEHNARFVFVDNAVEPEHDRLLRAVIRNARIGVVYDAVRHGALSDLYRLRGRFVLYIVRIVSGRSEKNSVRPRVRRRAVDTVPARRAARYRFLRVNGRIFERLFAFGNVRSRIAEKRRCGVMLGFAVVNPRVARVNRSGIRSIVLTAERYRTRGVLEVRTRYIHAQFRGRNGEHAAHSVAVLDRVCADALNGRRILGVGNFYIIVFLCGFVRVHRIYGVRARIVGKLRAARRHVAVRVEFDYSVGTQRERNGSVMERRIAAFRFDYLESISLTVGRKGVYLFFRVLAVVVRAEQHILVCAVAYLHGDRTLIYGKRTRSRAVERIVCKQFGIGVVLIRNAYHVLADVVPRRIIGRAEIPNKLARIVRAERDRKVFRAGPVIGKARDRHGIDGVLAVVGSGIVGRNRERLFAHLEYVRRGNAVIVARSVEHES